MLVLVCHAWVFCVQFSELSYMHHHISFKAAWRENLFYARKDVLYAVFLERDMSIAYLYFQVMSSESSTTASMVACDRINDTRSSNTIVLARCISGSEWVKPRVGDKKPKEIVQADDGMSTTLECLVLKCLVQMSYDVALPTNMRWKSIRNVSTP